MYKKKKSAHPVVQVASAGDVVVAAGGGEGRFVPLTEGHRNPVTGIEDSATPQL